MIIGNNLEALISERRFEVETIFPPSILKDSEIRNDWHELLMCQSLGEKRIIIEHLKLTMGDKSIQLSKGDIIMTEMGLDVSVKVKGLGLLTISWPSEFGDLERRTFLELNSSKMVFGETNLFT